jgi:hypothetical protein
MRYARILTLWAAICAGLAFAAHGVAVAWGQAGGRVDGGAWLLISCCLVLMVGIPLYLRSGT